MGGHSLLLCILAHSLDQAVGADGGIGSRDVVLIDEVRVRACSLSDDDIVKVDSGLQRATRTHTDELCASKNVDEFPRIQRDRRDTHTRAHNRYRGALVGTGEAQHVTHRVELLRILKVGLGNELGAKRISRQQDGRCNGGRRVDVRCRFHGRLLQYVCGVACLIWFKS